VQYGETIKNVYVDPSNPNFSYLQGFKGVNFQLYKNLDQNQVGINANVGIVQKISDEFRVSAAIQLPSLTWISEKYSPRVIYDYKSLRNWNDPTEPLLSGKVTWFENSFAYKLRMPAKFRGGFNWIAGKKGMLGVDLEYTDLSTTKLTEGDGGYNFVSENKIIRNTYKPTINVKLGGEIRSGDYRFRLGFAYYPSTLKAGSTYTNNVLKDTFYYTGGIGARFETWYWDVAMVLSYSGTDYNYVPASIDQRISTKISNSQLRIGFGFIL
jgi:long-subunit fatty acid transport protein